MPRNSLLVTLAAATVLACGPFVRSVHAVAPQPGLKHRWLFEFVDLNDPSQVDRVIARFPRAHADGYNGIVISAAVNPAKAPELRMAAKQYGLDIVAMVMGGVPDRNYAEGLAVKDALFVAHDGHATLVPDNPTHVVNGDFEDVSGNHFKQWAFQDDEGATTFADHEVTHSGKTSLRMENVRKNAGLHCRIMQPLKLQPWRHYKISFWVKTQDLAPAEPEVKVLDKTATTAISFQTFHVERTQDWTHYDLAFNSMGYSEGLLYVGTWNGKDGKMWWDDLSIDEIGLVNVLRRPGCPVTVKGEDGTAYEEGRDFQHIVDPILHPWVAYHDEPIIRLTANSRIADGQKLRVSFYAPILVYADSVTFCVSEPAVFDFWRDQVKHANELLHPAAFMMQHDEMRVMNQCALCRSKQMTAGQLLAWNIRKAAQIIRDVRPDAGIWVWSDMFDPFHNAVDHYYAVNGTLAGSWEGLDKDVGIVNWNSGNAEKSTHFFAGRGLRQVLSGYYDGDPNSSVAKWLTATTGLPGISGAMYTTWSDDYSGMDGFAAGMWGAPAGTKSTHPGK